MRTVRKPTPAATDFTKWTDAQLDVGAKYADGSPDGPALLAEIQRRKSEGTPDDGSRARVEALLTSARPARSADTYERAQARRRSARKSR